MQDTISRNKSHIFNFHKTCKSRSVYQSNFISDFYIMPDMREREEKAIIFYNGLCPFPGRGIYGNRLADNIIIPYLDKGNFIFIISVLPRVTYYRKTEYFIIFSERNIFPDHAIRTYSYILSYFSFFMNYRSFMNICHTYTLFISLLIAQTIS